MVQSQPHIKILLIIVTTTLSICLLASLGGIIYQIIVSLIGFGQSLTYTSTSCSSYLYVKYTFGNQIVAISFCCIILVCLLTLLLDIGTIILLIKIIRKPSNQSKDNIETISNNVSGQTEVLNVLIMSWRLQIYYSLISISLLLSAVYFGIWLTITIQLGTCRTNTIEQYIFIVIGALMLLMLIVDWCIGIYWASYVNKWKDQNIVKIHQEKKYVNMPEEVHVVRDYMTRIQLQRIGKEQEHKNALLDKQWQQYDNPTKYSLDQTYQKLKPTSNPQEASYPQHKNDNLSKIAVTGILTGEIMIHHNHDMEKGLTKTNPNAIQSYPLQSRNSNGNLIENQITIANKINQKDDDLQEQSFNNRVRSPKNSIHKNNLSDKQKDYINYIEDQNSPRKPYEQQEHREKSKSIQSKNQPINKLQNSKTQSLYFKPSKTKQQSKNLMNQNTSPIAKYIEQDLRHQQQVLYVRQRKDSIMRLRLKDNTKEVKQNPGKLFYFKKRNGDQSPSHRILHEEQEMYLEENSYKSILPGQGGITENQKKLITIEPLNRNRTQGSVSKKRIYSQRKVKNLIEAIRSKYV